MAGMLAFTHTNQTPAGVSVLTHIKQARYCSLPHKANMILFAHTETRAGMFVFVSNKTEQTPKRGTFLHTRTEQVSVFVFTHRLPVRLIPPDHRLRIKHPGRGGDSILKKDDMATSV